LGFIVDFHGDRGYPMLILAGEKQKQIFSPLVLMFHVIADTK
jgi:hypothetical protein